VALSVQHVSVRYDSDRKGWLTLNVQAPVFAVNDVSFTLADSDSLALLGPSGCGKSSLLRAIVGLEPLASGKVWFDGVDLAKVPVHRRGFGLLFQEGQLFPHRSVGRNVSYGLDVQRDSSVANRARRADRDARVAEVLDLVGLAGYQGRPIDTLSGGERQRVALARALAPQPRLLLLDEPFSALDRNLRLRLVTEVRDILQATKTSSITVTHDHGEAFTIANRVGIMQNGELLAIGTRDELESSQNPKVEEFLNTKVVHNP